MPGQVQKAKSSTAQAAKTETKETVKERTPEQEALLLDSLLDEIDAVLEENAEEFVKNYVQKGGE